MSEGVPHPSALKKTIESKIGSTILSASLSITDHRLASLVETLPAEAFQLDVWDWKTGDLLLVCEVFT